ncbi:MAG: hypothetical protein FWC02_03015 [Firmicutes bacterium]|nr:hypothetical protein [Bacillota bacterium]
MAVIISACTHLKSDYSFEIRENYLVWNEYLNKFYAVYIRHDNSNEYRFIKYGFGKISLTDLAPVLNDGRNIVRVVGKNTIGNWSINATLADQINEYVFKVSNPIYFVGYTVSWKGDNSGFYFVCVQGEKNQDFERMITSTFINDMHYVSISLLNLSLGQNEVKITRVSNIIYQNGTITVHRIVGFWNITYSEKSVQIDYVFTADNYLIRWNNDQSNRVFNQRHNIYVDRGGNGNFELLGRNVSNMFRIANIGFESGQNIIRIVSREPWKVTYAEGALNLAVSTDFWKINFEKNNPVVDGTFYMSSPWGTYQYRWNWRERGAIGRESIPYVVYLRSRDESNFIRKGVANGCVPFPMMGLIEGINNGRFISRDNLFTYQNGTVFYGRVIVYWELELKNEDMEFGNISFHPFVRQIRWRGRTSSYRIYRKSGGSSEFIHRSTSYPSTVSGEGIIRIGTTELTYGLNVFRIESAMKAFSYYRGSVIYGIRRGFIALYKHTNGTVEKVYL